MDCPNCGKQLYYDEKLTVNHINPEGKRKKYYKCKNCGYIIHRETVYGVGKRQRKVRVNKEI